MSRHHPSSIASQKFDKHWKRTRRLTLFLLTLWITITFGFIFFARELSEISLFGWSFSYYMAAQGIIFIYVTILAVYAWRMAKIDLILDHQNANEK